MSYIFTNQKLKKLLIGFTGKKQSNLDNKAPFFLKQASCVSLSCPFQRKKMKSELMNIMNIWKNIK